MSEAVAVVGLGAMGLPVSLRLLQAGFAVRGVDRAADARECFAAAGGRALTSAPEAASGARALVLLVLNDAQAEQILFGEGAAAALPRDAVVVLSVTTGPQRAAALGARLAEQGLQMVDCPVSGGVRRARDGTLAILTSGPPGAIAAARPFLTPLGRIYELGDRHGQASAVKLINQLLCGVHLAAAAEAIALAERAGVDPGRVYEVVMASSGASHMFADRVPLMLDEAPRATAAVEVLDKDLRLVAEMGARHDAHLPLAEAAGRLFAQAADEGWGALNDSEIIRLLRA